MKTMVMALLASQAVAGPVSHGTLVVDGETTVRARFGGHTIVATVSAETKTARDVFGERMAPGQFPDSVRIVKDLRIEVDRQSLFVPRSVFLDLAWVRTAELLQRGKRWVLVFKGGDASESFTVEVEFDKAAIRKLSLFSDLLPGKPLQETLYYQRSIP